MPETKAEQPVGTFFSATRWLRRPGRLSRQLSLLIRGILVAVFIFVYAYTVPMIKQKVFEIERNSARLALNNTYEIANRMYAGVEQYRQQALENRKDSLQMAVDLAESLIRSHVQEAMRRGLSAAEGRQIAMEYLRNSSFDDHDYIWVVDYNLGVLAHPDPKYRQAGDAASLSDTEISTLQTLVGQARREGSGFYSYRWPRLQASSGSDSKVSWVKDFPEWGLVIGSGVYLSDLEQQVEQRRQQALQDLRQALQQTHIARTGYLYVFDSSGYMLIHPNGNLDGIRFIRHENPLTGQPIYKELIAAADSGKELHYRWDKPDDPGNYAYEKLSLVRYMDGFDWYICSSVYLDELQSSSELLSTRIMVLAAITMLATLLISNFFVNRIARPLEQLAGTALRVRSGDLSARTGIQRDDEIGILASGFDAMVERLEDNIDTLDAEVRQRTQQLLESHNQAQRMSAVGQLAGGLAHDFNNLLSIVQGNLVIARERFGDNPELDALLAPAERAARRSADITHRLLAFARQQPLQAAPVRVDSLLQGTVELLSSSFTSRHQLSYQPDPSLQGCLARLDPGLLENALVNLGLNARDAMPNGGLLKLSAGVIDWPAQLPTAETEPLLQSLAFDETVPDGRYLLIECRDTGDGFSDEALAKAFEPFFTTKPGQLNSGLGLSMVFGFVKQSGGYLALANQTGGGAAVVLLLPVCAMTDPAAVVESHRDTAVTSASHEFAGQLFLLVDDDPDVREVVRQQLSALDIHVLEASDAEEALQLAETLRQSGSELAGVVSDVMMPGDIKGIELAQRLRQQMPGLLILLVSGYAFGADEDADNSGVVGWPLLRKPFDRQQLAQALRQANQAMESNQ
ncbi:cache domain-containing protein [Oceanobacter mangrovi]|uniref:cache domain-containing protein n=1 Tax=Oceanobacter mangrovi TaxID=2862510 RepID=UPI001C8D8C03|nr:cache domain-containing protein [Oceanobacter mangrovi]